MSARLPALTVSDVAAEIVGSPELSPQISEIIDISSHQGYIFHGVRDESRLQQINVEGVRALTPEGCHEEGASCSFWTSGERLFFGDPQSFNTFDSTFFHYAHLKPIEQTEVVMSVCIANIHSLVANGIHASQEAQRYGYLSIDGDIPRRLIDIVTVRRERDAKLLQRANGQLVEQDLIKSIRKVLMG